MVLAPQLRQSLEMLQLPILELRTMIQQELEKNPTLEEAASNAEQIEIQPDAKDNGDSDELNFDKEFEALAKLDDEWRDYFYQNLQNRPYSAEEAEKRQYVFDSIEQRESLQQHLLEQLRLSTLSNDDRQVGELIIGSIDDDGYLTSSVEELAASAKCDENHLRDILLIIQDFDPIGIGASDLRECLLLQLERLDKADSLAHRIVHDCLDKLAARKHGDIARQLNVGAEDVHSAAKLIATLDPKPGRAFSSEEAAYVLPEVVVQKIDGEYVVILNDDDLPHVRISRRYRQLLSDENTDPETRAYITERIRASAFLIKSIHQRQRTIRRIAEEIVKTQREFLEQGVSKLKPLTMAELASVVGVHETTVSRAVSGKYMKTPSGVFDMKYFFTPGIKMADGSQVSNETVKEMIAGIVANEDSDKPLSDQDIAEILKNKGIDIARRTIAKYRLMLKIPPSHMRKGF